MSSNSETEATQEQVATNNPQPITLDALEGLVEATVQKKMQEAIQNNAQSQQPAQTAAAQASPAQEDERLAALVKHFAGPDFDVDKEKEWVRDGQYRPAQAGGQPVQSTKPATGGWETMTPEQINNMPDDQVNKIIQDAMKGKDGI